MSEDVRGLVAALQRIQKEAPQELDDFMLEGAERYLAPAVRAATPVLNGSLRSATRVSRHKSGGVTFLNSKVYANTLHWGRKTLPRNGRRYPNVVKGTRFISRTIGSNRGAFDDFIAERVVTFMENEIPNG